MPPTRSKLRRILGFESLAGPRVLSSQTAAIYSETILLSFTPNFRLILQIFISRRWRRKIGKRLRRTCDKRRLRRALELSYQLWQRPFLLRCSLRASPPIPNASATSILRLDPTPLLSISEATLRWTYL